MCLFYGCNMFLDRYLNALNIETKPPNESQYLGWDIHCPILLSDSLKVHI